jgi:hypothetical protein
MIVKGKLFGGNQQKGGESNGGSYKVHFIYIYIYLYMCMSVSVCCIYMYENSIMKSTKNC